VGSVVSAFVYSYASGPLYMIKAGNSDRIISDSLGSPRLLINTVNGEIGQQLDYDTFGNLLNDTNPGFQPFGFAGGIDDPNTKLQAA